MGCVRSGLVPRVGVEEALNLIKYWKGQHMISVSPRVIQEHLGNESARNALQVDSTCFSSVWLPHAARVAVAEPATTV